MGFEPPTPSPHYLVMSYVLHYQINFVMVTWRIALACCYRDRRCVSCELVPSKTLIAIPPLRPAVEDWRS
jgi:hypothetical protein